MIARPHLLLTGLLTFSLAARAQEQDDWSVEPSLYLFIAGVSGTVGVGDIDVDLGGPSTAIVHVNFGAMGRVRVGYGAWALTADVLYADLGFTNDPFSGNVQELIVEPTLGYRIDSWLEPLLGVRYDRVGGDLSGPSGNVRARTEGWVDPIIGVHLMMSPTDSLSLHFRGDIGGFSVGSRLTWQVYPYLRWQFSKPVSLEAGYRILSIDYQQGEGSDRIKFDVLELGPQIGLTLSF